LPGLDELLITTNGSQLVRYSEKLKQAGVTRLNVSLDSLNAERFKAMTRNGDLNKVLAGIDAAREQGFEHIKINAVVMKGSNADEILPLLEYARDKQLDIAYIEEMPLGNIDSHDRALSFCSSDEVMEEIETRYSLLPMAQKTAGPSRYFQMADSDIRVGFISPHSHNFCADCNRVRVTAEGRLLLCLGNEHSVDLLPVMRAQPGAIEPVKEAIIKSMSLKPERHYFDLNEDPQILRFMNATGG
jgi:cyclic pyranopterin phosphate synthase